MTIAAEAAPLAGAQAGLIRMMVCTTCRAPGADPDAPRPGARLHAALEAAIAADPALESRLSVEPVECLSVCKRPCTVALSGPDRWTYVYGDLDPETAVETLIGFADQYRATGDGIVTWRERPDIIRKGVVARIPPLR
jgi:predicted metal-binding protein